MLFVDVSHDILHLIIAHFLSSMSKRLLHFLISLMSHTGEHLPNDLDINLSGEGSWDIKVYFRHILPYQDLVVELSDIAHDFFDFPIVISLL
jgi:hypothetical protein